MSYFLIEYLEQRVKTCDQMIEDAPDSSTRRIYEATRRRYVDELDRIRREAAAPDGAESHVPMSDARNDGNA